MPTFRAPDRTELAYRTLGSGPGVPLLLLHGFPLGGRLWERVAPALAARGPVVVADLRGHGGSGVPAGPYTMEALAGDAAALLAHLGHARAYVAGHSMGGYAALALAERHPARVAGLALVHSHPFADDDAARRARYELAARIATLDRPAWNAEMRKKMTAPGYADPDGAALLEGMIAATGARSIAASAAGMALRPDRSEVWRRYAGPALFVYGRHDGMVPPAKSAAAAALRESPAVALDAGHAGMVEAPAACAAALLAWWPPSP